MGLESVLRSRSLWYKKRVILANYDNTKGPKEKMIIGGKPGEKPKDAIIYDSTQESKEKCTYEFGKEPKEKMVSEDDCEKYREKN